MDICGAAVSREQEGSPAPVLLGGGLYQLLAGGPPEPAAAVASNTLLGYTFGIEGTATAGCVSPTQAGLALC